MRMSNDNTNLDNITRERREAEESKKRCEDRLREIEAEASMLRAKIAACDTVIDEAGMALRKLLFPTEDAAPTTRRAPVSPPPRQPVKSQPRVETRRPVNPPPTGYYTDPMEQAHLDLDDLEAIESGTAAQRLNKNAGNVRFNDFRIPQAATIILREAGEPLHVSEIYQRMAEGGFEFRGQHQLITLAVSLSRAKRFRKVAPGTFELDPRYAAGQVA